MASLQRKGGGWYCQFVRDGKRYTFAIGQVDEAEAKAKAAQVDYLLMRLKQGLIALPPGVGVVDFVRHDGAPPGRVVDVGGLGFERVGHGRQVIERKNEVS